jgi:hypothetical protein
MRGQDKRSVSFVCFSQLSFFFPTHLSLSTVYCLCLLFVLGYGWKLEAPKIDRVRVRVVARVMVRVSVRVMC